MVISKSVNIFVCDLSKRLIFNLEAKVKSKMYEIHWSFAIDWTFTKIWINFMHKRVNFIYKICLTQNRRYGYFISYIFWNVCNEFCHNILEQSLDQCILKCTHMYRLFSPLILDLDVQPWWSWLLCRLENVTFYMISQIII